uniref:Helicase domino n=1 Tax=Magallana gigas TaxID=29159 RepID=K1QQY7_MAGGI
MSNQTVKNTSSLLGASSSTPASSNRSSIDSKPTALNLTFPNLTALANQSGPSPKKKVKLEEMPATTQEIANHRKLILDLNITSKSAIQAIPQAKTVNTTIVTTVASSTVSMPQLHSHLAKAITENKSSVVQTSLTVSAVVTSSPKITASTSVLQTTKSPPISPSLQQSKVPIISGVYDGTPGVGTQEAIVERAKQEAQVMQRVAELRKEGLWSTRKLPKVQESPRNKGHWDYLLEEMQWLAADFTQERKWKKAAARKVAKMVSKYFQDLEQREIKAEKEEALKLKKIASQLAKQVREFWSNIEKVVQYKAQARLEEKRKKALDLHLNFIVDQTEKYSTWLTEGLKKEGGSLGSGSNVVTPSHSDVGDDEFKPLKDDVSDDEETIEREEAELDQLNSKAELDALQKESELPIEELLKTLPKEVLEHPISESSDKDDKKDTEFKMTEDEEKDEEETIAEQENYEKRIDYSKELIDLKDEGEMTMKELYEKYAGAYDSDFEIPEEEGDSGDEDSSQEEEEEEEESDEDEEEEEILEEDEKEDIGLEFLTKKDDDSKSMGDFDQDGPGKDISDIAAQAQSLQPKGYTLETTTASSISSAAF